MRCDWRIEVWKEEKKEKKNEKKQEKENENAPFYTVLSLNDPYEKSFQSESGRSTNSEPRASTASIFSNENKNTELSHVKKKTFSRKNDYSVWAWSSMNDTNDVSMPEKKYFEKWNTYSSL